MNQPRLLQTADVPEIMRILQDVYEGTYNYPVGGGWTAAQIERELENGAGLGVFGENYRLRAFVIFKAVEELYDIVLLATDPGERRRGLMSSLLEFLRISWGGGRTLWLEVHEKNSAARNLYEKQGFREQGRRLHYYRDGGSAILYSL